MDENGEPLVVWHGTSSAWEAYDLGKNKNQWAGNGINLTSDPSRASNHGDIIMPLFASVKNLPEDGYEVETDGNGKHEWRKTGHWLVKSTIQIKSATDTSGAFSPETPIILGMAKRVAAVVDELDRIGFEGGARRGIVDETDTEKTLAGRVQAGGLKNIPSKSTTPTTRACSLQNKFDTHALDGILQRHGIARHFTEITNSQGRYLASFWSVDAIGTRFATEGQKGRVREDEGDTQGQIPSDQVNEEALQGYFDFNGIPSAKQPAAAAAIAAANGASAAPQVVTACRRENVSRQTAYHHREMFPAFAAAWDEAIEDGRASFADHIDAIAYERAVVGIKRTRFNAKGQPIGEFIHYSDRLLIALAKRHLPALHG